MIEDTRCIDRWICPYCKSLNEEPEWDFVDRNGRIIKPIVVVGMSQPCKCPKCGKWSEVSISPEFIASPCDENYDED